MRDKIIYLQIQQRTRPFSHPVLTDRQSDRHTDKTIRPFSPLVIDHLCGQLINDQVAFPVHPSINHSAEKSINGSANQLHHQSNDHLIILGKAIHASSFMPQQELSS